MASVLHAPGQRRSSLASFRSSSTLSESPSSSNFRRNFILHSYRESAPRCVAHPGTKKLRKWSNDHFLGVASNALVAKALSEGAVHAGFYLRANDPTPFNVTFPRDITMRGNEALLGRYLGGAEPERQRERNEIAAKKKGSAAATTATTTTTNNTPRLESVDWKLRDVLSRLGPSDGEDATSALLAIERTYLSALAESATSSCCCTSSAVADCGRKPECDDDDGGGGGRPRRAAFEDVATAAFVSGLSAFLTSVPTLQVCRTSPGVKSARLAMSFSPSSAKGPMIRMLLYSLVQYHGRAPFFFFFDDDDNNGNSGKTKGEGRRTGGGTAPRFATTNGKGGARVVVVSWTCETATQPSVPEEEEDASLEGDSGSEQQEREEGRGRDDLSLSFARSAIVPADSIASVPSSSSSSSSSFAPGSLLSSPSSPSISFPAVVVPQAPYPYTLLAAVRAAASAVPAAAADDDDEDEDEDDVPRPPPAAAAIVRRTGKPSSRTKGGCRASRLLRKGFDFVQREEAKDPSEAEADNAGAGKKRTVSEDSTEYEE